MVQPDLGPNVAFDTPSQLAVAQQGGDEGEDRVPECQQLEADHGYRHSMVAAAGDGEAIVCLLMPERKTTSLAAGAAVAAAAAVAEPPGTTTAVSVTTAAVPGSSSTAAGATGALLPVAVDSQSSAAKFLLIEVRECIPMGGEEWERERAPYDRGVSAYATLLEGKLWRHGCGGKGNGM